MNTTPTLFCPHCAANNQNSTVQDNGISETLMAVTTYYDEKGHYHSHNPNRRSHSFKCSNGHCFNVLEPTRACPAEECTWPKPEEICS